MKTHSDIACKFLHCSIDHYIQDFCQTKHYKAKLSVTCSLDNVWLIWII